MLTILMQFVSLIAKEFFFPNKIKKTIILNVVKCLFILRNNFQDLGKVCGPILNHITKKER